MSTDQQKGDMSFLEHLEVFRWHLVRSAFAILFFAILAFIFKSIVFDSILLGPKTPDFRTYQILCYLSSPTHQPYAPLRSDCISSLN